MASVTAPAPAAVKMKKSRGRDKPTLGRQLVLQAICLLILFTVLFPVLWIVSMALDPRNLSRPDGLNLIPPGASLDSFIQVIRKPTSNPVDFITLAFNSFKIASLTSLFSIAIGVSAAYAFSRFNFRFRSVLMIAILGVLMLPAVATLAPLFVFLNRITVDFTGVPILGDLLGEFNLRNSQLGVMLAITSGLLPFSIWNLKGYLDTIPKELEEAAAVDGAGRNQTFIKIILPLATPALAVTAFLGFIGGWTEFYFSWMFLTKPSDFTLSMALYSMVGQYARTTPWSLFAAFAILVAVPPAVVYFFAQKYIVSGLSIGGVKG
jgi:arabinogalactan oligomer/maltooligosaccharide transport system permease protein